MVRMIGRWSAILVLLLQSTVWVSAQGLTTTASKDDWEEINFEYNSSVLVDGFPSLLRLAELLQANPDYRVRIEGHTDGIGSSSFNDKLGMARATMVRDFLVKYGAKTGQMDTISRGKTDPKVPNPNPQKSYTDVARYMNRRVVLSVMDAQGRTVGAGGPGDVIRALNQAPGGGGGQNGAGQNGAGGPGGQGAGGAGAPGAGGATAAGVTDCCSEVLKRLDKLDDIARMLKDLADQNADLRRQLDAVKQDQQAMQNKMNQPVPEAPKPPSAPEIAKEVRAELAANTPPKFQLLGANIGEDTTGHVSFTGTGRFFAPMGTNFGFQAQAEYYYLRGQREGQGDIGLVDRMGKHVEAGLFASFKNVSLAGNQTSGTVGQGALSVDYIFSRGKIGLFGTKGFMDNALINSANAVDINGNPMRNVILQRYLKVVDQAGVGATIGLWGNVYAQGNLGYLKSTVYGDHLGGTVKLVFPMNDHFAFTAEGGANETMLNVGNSGRAVFGVQFGNMMRPKEYLAADHAIPMEVPRVHYEVLTKRVRTGNDPPVADAGPSLTNVAAGTVQLDGSASYDPDGDPITFQWIQEGGTQIALSNPTSAKTSFTAVAGVTYAFRLVVKDDHGGTSQARVTITTKQGDRATIVSFTATPATINSGQTSTLTWVTQNADTVNISGIGNVAASGSANVSPTITTTYTLTAVNTVNQITQTATVVVNPAGGGGGANGQVQIVSFAALPTQIQSGQASVLSWNVLNADTVTISGIGSVASSGATSVSPTVTTTYTLTAHNATSDRSLTATVVVNGVGGGGGGNTQVQIVSFVALPTQIQSGQASTLSWNVLNADTVTISGIGTVAAAGATSVSPTVTTTYSLTAHNATSDQTLTATVVVTPASGGGGTPTTNPLILSCFATPSSITAGQSAVLNWSTSGATAVTIQPAVGAVAQTGTFTVTPAQTTNYTLTATGPTGSTPASCNIAVTVAAGTLPQIARFSAIPATIDAGQTSTLLWVVNNATTVSISSVGNVPLSGTQDVTPAATTTYTLTATNATGSVTATAQVTVNPVAPAPHITSFTANPTSSPAPGTSVVLACSATNATALNLGGVVFAAGNATLTVAPQATTTYTCTASNAKGQTDSSTLTVTVAGTGGGGGGGGPVIVLPDSLFTATRYIILDASASFSPTGDTPLKFFWTTLDNKAAIANPNSPTPNVWLSTGSGPWVFELIVTDSKGKSSTKQITVRLTQGP